MTSEVWTIEGFIQLYFNYMFF